MAADTAKGPLLTRMRSLTITLLGLLPTWIWLESGLIPSERNETIDRSHSILMVE